MAFQAIGALLILQILGLAAARLLACAKPIPLAGFIGHLISWDGSRYFDIGLEGYTWDPAASTTVQQNMAFFPGQAIIDHLLMHIGGAVGPLLIIAATLVCGLASIILFEPLARKVLTPKAVRPAVFCFAFWPASSFYLMGYPTGLMSICIIAAYTDHLDKRFWRPALWLGLGTFLGPTVVFAGAALGLLHTLEALRNRGFRQLLRLVLWGLLALSGLIAFMLYQQIAFHDPFAFVRAQAAWGIPPAARARLQALLNLRRYLQQPCAGLDEIQQARYLIGHRQPGAALLATGIQRLINFAIFGLTFIGLIAATFTLRGRAAVITAAGWIVFLGYCWSVAATNMNILSVPRLLFPAIAAFLGLGITLPHVPVAMQRTVITILALLSCTEAAFAALGFWVV